MDYFLTYIAAYTGLFIFERTLGFFISNDEAYQSYIIRVFGNLTNLGSRYVLFTDTGKLSLTGLSYMLAGGGVLSAAYISLKSVYNFKSFERATFLSVVSYSYIVVILLFSISPLIQPRYLIPLAFLVLSVYIRGKSVQSTLFLLGGAYLFLNLLRSAYIFSGIGLPEVENYDFMIYSLFL